MIFAKSRKLNAQGFAHHFLLALIVVGVACVGTYYVVFSKADTVAYQNGRIGLDTETFGLGGGNFVSTNTGNIQTAALSPNGGRFAYQIFKANDSDGKPVKIGIAKVGETNIDNNKVFNLPAGIINALAIKWSPDGQWLMIEHSLAQDNSYGAVNGIWIVKPDGSSGHAGPDFRYNEGSEVAWLPDSDSILFTRVRNNSSGHYQKDDLCTMKLDGTERKCAIMPGLGRKVWGFGSMQVSNDGTKVLFRSIDDYIDSSHPQAMNAYIIDIDGKNLHALTNYTDGIQVSAAVLSPDNKLVLYVVNSKFYTVNIDGSDTRLRVGLSKSAGVTNITGWARGTSVTAPVTSPVSNPTGPTPTYTVACDVQYNPSITLGKVVVSFTNTGNSPTQVNNVTATLSTDESRYGGAGQTQVSLPSFSLALGERVSQQDTRFNTDPRGVRAITVNGVSSDNTPFSCSDGGGQ